MFLFVSRNKKCVHKVNSNRKTYCKLASPPLNVLPTYRVKSVYCRPAYLHPFTLSNFPADLIRIVLVTNVANQTS